MLRAMQEVVSPAIDENNSLAREQAALVIGQLKLLAGQWSRVEGYARACLADLAQSLDIPEPEKGDRTRAAFASLRTAIEGRNEERAEDHFKAVMAAADVLVRATDVDGEDAFRKQLRQNLLAFSKRQSLRDRSWFSPSGFDLKPHELRDVDDIIKGQAN
jgi:hypothetical protein